MRAFLRSRENIQFVFVLETLEYLQRGGRIGKAQAFVGTLLRFKPLLGIVDGEVVPLAHVRSRAKAFDTTEELLTQRVPERGAGVRMAFTNALAPEETWAFGARLSKVFQSPDFYVADLGPVIGVHTGPGTIGVAVVAAG